MAILQNHLKVLREQLENKNLLRRTKNEEEEASEAEKQSSACSAPTEFIIPTLAKRSGEALTASAQHDNLFSKLCSQFSRTQLSPDQKSCGRHKMMSSKANFCPRFSLTREQERERTAKY